MGWLLRGRDVHSATMVPKGGISLGFPLISTGNHKQVTLLSLREVLDM